MMKRGLGVYLYTDDWGMTACSVPAFLEDLTERHKVLLPLPTDRPIRDVFRELESRPELRGLIISPGRGWVGRGHLRLAQRTLALGKRAFFYWPLENAIECADVDRMRSHFRIWAALRAWETTKTLWRHNPVPQMVKPPAPPPLESVSHLAELQATLVAAKQARAGGQGPTSLELAAQPTAERRVKGCGAYLRTDFWAAISSGGSYGHTCYVAKELAAVTEDFVCFMPHRYELLEDLGLRQVVMEVPSPYGTEKSLVDATPFYVERLRPALRGLKPAYLYERLCLGNYAGALLSQELEIPYIVEYNGSEISMKRSFEGNGYFYEDFYLQAEEAAFAQATLISVVSKHVKADLVARGVEARKILVNPNGADPDAYAPATPALRRELRGRFGWNDDHRVIGFTGTFGGWHGIEVLADALPRICAEVSEARFLLIGDGNFKHLVDGAIASHKLEDRVLCAGRVPQREGARLLSACDIYLSPHSRNMADSPFFGSPTKLFEYMGMGGAIVASDLEQIGEVLQPALRPRALAEARIQNEVAVLCRPGDVDELVEAVVHLSRRPELSSALGANARRALVERFSWRHHVRRLFAALRGEAVDVFPASRSASGRSGNGPVTSDRLATGDVYKDQTQHQWDNDPAGSHYVKRAAKHTLAWYLEAEDYRYREYAPWMRETMEFERQSGKDVLEIGGGLGTDLAQFARHGARVTNVDLSAGHLALAEESFRLRGLQCTFVHHDAETLPFPAASFDLVYSNGVIHHTPNTQRMVDEIHRVLRPGGRVIVMVYAENSLHYWRIVLGLGLWHRMLADYSIGEIMSRTVELSTAAGARPLVKVYRRQRLRRLFAGFEDVRIVQRQLTPPEVPRPLRFLPAGVLARLAGWNLVLKARKPR